MSETLIGEVQQLVNGRWRTVLVGNGVPVVDRRRHIIDREPTFGPKKTTQKENP